ncbi:hypothetical protein CR513_12900, partial [Mucuna pruriens]
MWKHKRGSRWKNKFRKHTKEMKDKMQMVHFKSECPNLEKEKEKEKKKPLIKKKKILMATWENLDMSSIEDEDEEANLCLMVDTTSKDEDDEEFGCRSYDYKECPKEPSKPSRTNPKGPKKIWVPKTMTIPIADVFNSMKKTPVMVPGQWMLMTHDRRRVYAPKALS